MNLHIVFAAASLLLSQAHIDAVERLRGVSDPGTTEAGEPWPAASELPAELKDLWGEHVDERYAAATSRIDSIAQPMPEHVRESLDASN
jgi:hypothetical protein